MFYRPADGRAGLQEAGLAHDPIKALVAPRPIAWVSTLDAAGRANLAPFSFFNLVAEAPPIVMFAPYGRKPEEDLEKDTLRNVLATEEFVVNVAPKRLKEAMNLTSAPFLAGEDEFAAAGLTPAPSREVGPPRVGESPIALECRLLFRTPLPSTRPDIENGVVFGEVLGVHIDDALVSEGKVDITAVAPLARLGYLDYAAVEEVFAMPRPARPES